MKKIFFVAGELSAFLFLALFSCFKSKAQVVLVSDTFRYTGATQTLFIPFCASVMTVQVLGAIGGWGSGGNAYMPGNGGSISGVLSATPGVALYINVGSMGTGSVGGFNGGGNGGQGSLNYGGGGGGATDIRIGGNTLTDRVIVAGGGGGGGSYSGSYGGGGGNFMFVSAACGTNGVGGEGGWGPGNGWSVGGGCSGGNGTLSYCGGAGGGITSAGSVSGSGSGGYGQGGGPGQGGNGGDAGGTYGGGGGGINGGGGGGSGYYGGAGGMTASLTSGGSLPMSGGGGGGSTFGNSTLFSSISFNGSSTSNGLVLIRYYATLPFVSVSTNSLSLCSGSSATLGASGVSSYTWLPAGSFAGSTASVITVSPTTPTQYTVLGENASGCISQKIISVQAGTLITAYNSSYMCSGSTATLNAGPGALSYSWSAAGTFTGSSASSITVSPASATNYTVTGTYLSGCISKTVTAVSVSVPSTVIPTYYRSACSGTSFTLDTGTSLSYTWLPVGTFTGANTPSLVLIPTSSANYSVNGTSAAGCISQTITALTVLSTSLSTAPSLSLCAGTNTTLTASGASSYTWLPGGSNLSSLAIAPLASAQYTVKGANSYGCLSQSIVAVNVGNVLSPIQSLSVCVGTSTVINASGAFTYTWLATGSFPGSNSSGITVAPFVTTSYTVTGTHGGCISQRVATVTVGNLVSAATSVSICNGATATLSASGVTSYTWLPTGSFTGSNSPYIVITPAVSANYTVNGTSSGCISQKIISVTVGSLSTITNSLSICEGASATLSAMSASGYTWFPAGSFGGSNTSSIMVAPVASTNYTVNTATPAGCLSQTVIAVNVIGSVTATSSLFICSGANVTLVTGGASTYTWLPSGLFNGSNASSVSVSPSVSTNYTVNSTSSGGCKSQSVITVSVGFGLPVTITSSPGNTVCLGESVVLTTGNASGYSWINSINSNTLTTPGIIVNPLVNATYSVIVFGANTCTSSASLKVYVMGCTGIFKTVENMDNVVIYPNPNNGIFTIQSDSDIELSILNELGECIKIIQLHEKTGREISLQGLADGVYFIIGRNKNSMVTKKIVVTGN